MKNFLSAAVLAGAVAVATVPVQAATESIATNGVTTLSTGTYSGLTGKPKSTTVYTAVLNLLANTTYDISVTWAGAIYNISGWQTVVTGPASSGPFGATNNYVKTHAAFSGTNTSAFSVATDGWYTFVTTLSSIGGSASLFAPATLTSATVSGTFGVPGPIAGAGLPVVLGLMGFAAYRRRANRTA